MNRRAHRKMATSLHCVRITLRETEFALRVNIETYTGKLVRSQTNQGAFHKMKKCRQKTRICLWRQKIELAATAPELLSKPRYMHSLYIKAFRVNVNKKHARASDVEKSN